MRYECPRCGWQAPEWIGAKMMQCPNCKIEVVKNNKPEKKKPDKPKREIHVIHGN